MPTLRVGTHARPLCGPSRAGICFFSGRAAERPSYIPALGEGAREIVCRSGSRCRHLPLPLTVHRAIVLDPEETYQRVTKRAYLD